jgi:GNAT superfamily N-acetyltransferase
LSDSLLLIRPAAATDLPAVLALYAQPEMDDGAVLPICEAERLFARFAQYPDYTLYVAEEGADVVGTFALLVMDNLGHLGAPSAIVEDVLVAPDRHGNGIGQTMMRFAAETAKAKGCCKLMLSSGDKRIRAHAFYEQLGFDRHGVSFRLDLNGGSP